MLIINKRTVSLFAVAVIIAGLLAGCNDRAETKTDTVENGQADMQSEIIELEEPVKTFLIDALPDDYSFYTLETFLPVTMDDLLDNGIFIGSRVPDGLLPENVVSQLYGGAFLSGTVITMGEGSDGMDKFGGIELLICIGISPDGCINALRDDGVKRIILFSDDDAEKATIDLIKIDIK